MHGIRFTRANLEKKVRFLFIALSAFLVPDPVWSIAKVYLKSGETRVGSVMVRDGRVTIHAVDRLFQHPVEAVHRIDYVSGETTLVADDVLLREKPEAFSRNLASLSKGCEVRILDHEDQWTRVEVFAGRSRAEGYLHDDDLSDTVYFDDVSPTTIFKAPPPSLLDRFRAPDSTGLEIPSSVGDLTQGIDETGFNRMLIDRLWGSSVDDILKQQEILQENEEKGDLEGNSNGDVSPADPGEPIADEPKQ